MTFVEAARTYVGVPWKHLGRTRKGLDCAGLPVVAAADIGKPVPDVARYGRNPFQDGLTKAVEKALGRAVWTGKKGSCELSFLEVGDVVMMSPASLPRHLAIVGDDPLYGLSLLHADGSPGVGKVVEHGLSEYFLKMIVAVYRRDV